MLELIYISIVTACVASIWVINLTDLNGLLWWVPKYYPYEEKFLGKILRCAVCLSGWITLITSLTWCLIAQNYFVHIIPAVFLSMATAKIISR